MSGGQGSKPVVFTAHARERARERGAREEDVVQAIRIGQREAAQRGLDLYRLNLPSFTASGTVGAMECSRSLP